MIMLMFHFKGLFRHLLEETKEIVAASCPASHDILYLEICGMSISRLHELSQFLFSLPIRLLFMLVQRTHRPLNCSMWLADCFHMQNLYLQMTEIKFCCPNN